MDKGEDVANYAYLRVSTDQQDVDNQRHGILEYANRNGISSIQFVEDTVRVFLPKSTNRTIPVPRPPCRVQK